MPTVTPQPSFTPDTSVGGSFGFASSNILLPGTPVSDACVRVANLGPCPIAVKLGTSSAVTVTQSTGLAILPGEAIYLTLGSNTYIAGVAAGGPSNSSTVNITTGT